MRYVVLVGLILTMLPGQVAADPAPDARSTLVQANAQLGSIPSLIQTDMDNANTDDLKSIEQNLGAQVIAVRQPNIPPELSDAFQAETLGLYYCGFAASDAVYSVTVDTWQDPHWHDHAMQNLQQCQALQSQVSDLLS